MKKHLVLFLAFFLLSNVQKSEAQAFEQGDVNINAGVGLWVRGAGVGTMVIPPVSISIDYGVSEKISIGAWAGYASNNYLVTGAPSAAFDWNYNYTAFGLRGDYHVDMNSDKLDLYGGLNAGYAMLSIDKKNSANAPGIDASSTLILGAQLGAKYLLTDHIGLFAEGGYGFAVTRFGVNIKL